MIEMQLAESCVNVKEVGTDWVSLCWKRPDVRRTTASPFLMYKVEAWLCGEGAYWVEVGRSPIPQFDIFNLKPKREYYFRRVAKRHNIARTPCMRGIIREDVNQLTVWKTSKYQ